MRFRAPAVFILGLAFGALLFSGCPAPTEPDAGRDAGTRDTPRADVPLVDGGADDAPLDAAVEDAPADAPSDGGTPPSVARPVIYQLVVRLFSNTDETRSRDGTIAENGVGHFADIDATALTAIRDLGTTHVWLTGVLRQATLTDHSSVDSDLAADDPDIVKGRAGSFYAVRDYYDVSPDYAEDPARRLEEFSALVSRIHAAGMQVIIDLVPNHVARSYGSVVHPEWDFGAGDDRSVFFSPSNSFFNLPGGSPLVLSRPPSWTISGVTFDGRFGAEDGAPGRAARATGNNVTSLSPSANDWYETIKLNWGANFADGSSDFDPVPTTWTLFDHVIEYWQDLGVDGFRCDFAHFVPTEAWQYLIDRARTRDASAFFFAEAYENLPGLLGAGFDAVYHDAAYDALKGLYLGRTSQEQLSDLFGGLSELDRGRYLHYLENHDERRIASPIVTSGGVDDSGFGGSSAAHQLAPLVYLYSHGPILVYNGQEVGEPGAGIEGFGGEDGRTSIFDYWSMPRMVGWVNGRAYDGGGLDAAGNALRAYYADLLALSQDPSARGAGYWGLEYWNDPGRFADAPEGFYSFGRFEPGSERLMIVVANFAAGAASTGRVRVPLDLATAAGLPSGRAFVVSQVLTEAGAVDVSLGPITRDQLITNGFAVSVPDQSAHVFIIE